MEFGAGRHANGWAVGSESSFSSLIFSSSPCLIRSIGPGTEPS